MATYPGVFELCQAGLGVPASRPQERHTLVGPITLGDDLLSLGVRSGTRLDERPHPGIVDHMLHDLWEGLALAKPVTSAGLAAHPKPFRSQLSGSKVWHASIFNDHSRRNRDSRLTTTPRGRCTTRTTWSMQ